ncbi:hypothetical protein HELRODRAFT_91227 [Helobdella robusta]|uniref:Translin-associated protein X n=1 Tax=Helobdella robusta TaxID=6412 RepID=T1G812_HELRO|nr:hypothetical protein HELRODRAFT_91227 [Helobdella robusta]ESN89932.1 hypothetical protein HELRODRAFT_91227 [Helobdella robusta]
MKSYFENYRDILDDRNDRYEKLVKLSRDVTIESKRLIFLLQRSCDIEKNDRDIKYKLKILVEKWKLISSELNGDQKCYEYLRAYSPGLQEYIEALLFHHFKQHRCLLNLQEIQNHLIFIQGFDDSSKETQLSSSGRILVSPNDYLLGVADFTGEVMRYCISTMGKNDINTSQEICEFLRSLFDSFVSLHGASKYLSKKVDVMQQSLLKVESALYTLKIRGSELPAEHLLTTLNSIPLCQNEDE